MKHLFLLTAVTIAHLSNPLSAGTMGPFMSKDQTWVASFSAGPVWSSAGETQTFFLTPDIEKTYVADQSNNVFASGELFAGIQKPLSSQWLGQLGLALAMTGNAELQGVIWDDAAPEFDNYSYLYKVRNTRVALKGKLLVDKNYWLMPWVSASIGVGFNHAHGFSNTPFIFEALANSNFADHTNTTFTYTLGAGLQKSFTENWQVRIGYELADWGKSSLGLAAEQTMGSGLRLNHLYTNGILLNLTYIA